LIACEARLRTPNRGLSTANMQLSRAKWASEYFGKCHGEQIINVAEAVARAAYENSKLLAQQTVSETGYGVVEHKILKNQLCTFELLDYYRDLDLISHRITDQFIEIPKPAGVIFALTPVTNPIATIFYKAMISILSRNTILFSPHPAAKNVSVAATKIISEAAVAAGAPEGIFQCIGDPTVDLVEKVMASENVDVILATGGSSMVRAAYSSGNPALGVGPGNAVAYVDETADVESAAAALVESKSFDNSILCTNESICLTLESSQSNMIRALRSAGAHICDASETDRLRDFLWKDGIFNLEAIGRSATHIADAAGLRVNPATKILVPVVEKPGLDDLLFREKLCPVLALTSAVDFAQAITFAKHVSRKGAGHSAAFHGSDMSRLTQFASALPVYRVVVNAPCSQAAAGFGSHLAPSFMIGTGFAGRSSIGENVGPQHLVHWTKVALPTGGNHSGRSKVMDSSFQQSTLNLEKPRESLGLADTHNESSLSSSVTRSEIRDLILEELKILTRKNND